MTFVTSDICTQRRFRYACALSQFDRTLRWTRIAKDTKLLKPDSKYADQTALIPASILLKSMSDRYPVGPITINVALSGMLAGG